MVSNQDRKDAETYKQFALSGADLMFPCTIKGRSHRPDNNIMYHVTIMLFDVEKDSMEEAHEIATRLPLNPPNSKKLTVKMDTMKGRTGYNLYNINLYGMEANKIEKLYNEFAHMGYHSGYKFQAHISIDKELYDELQKEGGKTAFEIGIEFFPAELRKGDKKLASYKPSRPVEWGREYPEPDELKASENLDVGSMKETLLLSLEIHPEHLKAVALTDSVFKNYLQDNPDLKEHLLVKHEERAHHHFSRDLELFEYALKNGIRKTYELLRKK